MMHQALGGDGWWMFIKVFGASLQAAVIILFRYLSRLLFEALTDFENWKTESEYHTALVSKRMCFAFVNSYFPLVFVSFMVNHVQIFGVDISCPNKQCMDYVEMMIAVIFTIQIAQRFIQDTVLPYYEKKKADEKRLAEADPDEDAMEEHEEQMTLQQYDGLDRMYTEKVVEIGYFMFFGADFPLLSLMVVLTTAVEIRLHARRFVQLLQRPQTKVVKDIGQWTTTLDIWAVSSILIQCCFIGYTTRALEVYFPGMLPVDRLFYAVTIEHSLLIFKVLWDSKYAGVPDEVQLAYERKNYERGVLLETFDTPNFDKTVGFFTEDEGNIFYGKVQE